MPRRLRTKEEKRVLHADVLQRFLLTDSNISQIGKDLRVDPAQVRHILRVHHVPLLRKSQDLDRPARRATARNQSIREQHRQGVSVATLAARFSISDTRVRSILRAQGVKAENAHRQRLARAARNRQIVAAKVAGQSNEAIAATFELSVARVAEILADKKPARRNA